ncbi:MAG: hypothetical protein KatS3mg009_2206 [Acidimicrobiia bacterium]|nr:MAG: hypothetical protein KatS3mg009_2206 [Acidimicrobiia bacterium]
MRFDAEHRFAAAPGEVAAAWCDPAFHLGTALPDVAVVELVAHDRDGTGTTLALRYAYVGGLDPVARRVLGGAEPTWVQTLVLDRSTLRGRLTITPDRAADRLRAGAAVTLRAEGGGTLRHLAGDLEVRVPLVGGAAARGLVAGVLRRLDAEAAALAARLGEGA